MNELLIKKKLESFLIEDVGTGDLSAETIFPQDNHGNATFQAKADGIIAGLQIIKTTYQLLDPQIEVTLHKQDGEQVVSGELIAEVTGSIQNLLTGERVILNLLQRMSGIATITYEAVQRLQQPNIRICDTRKTTPGLRLFEKYAVTCGGGYNHRIGLYDGVMIKDNHIAFAGSIEKAVKQVRAKLGPMVKIEVETESIDQVKESISAGADIIMFDNQTPETVAEWNDLVPNNIVTEASGNITLKNIATYRNTGIDYISLGCITHSAIALDISLNVSARLTEVELPKSKRQLLFD